MGTHKDRPPTYGVITYRTTSAALHSERILTRAGLSVRVIDVPRSLSTDCCQGVRIAWEAREAAARALEEAGVPYVAILSWPK